MRVKNEMETAQASTQAHDNGQAKMTDNSSQGESKDNDSKLQHSDSGQGRSILSTELSEENILNDTGLEENHNQSEESHVNDSKVSHENNLSKTDIYLSGGMNACKQNDQAGGNEMKEQEEEEEEEQTASASKEKHSPCSVSSGQGENSRSVCNERIRRQEPCKTSLGRQVSDIFTDPDSGIERTPDQGQGTHFRFSQLHESRAVFESHEHDTKLSMVREFVEKQNRPCPIRFCKSVSIKHNLGTSLQRRSSLPDLSRIFSFDISGTAGLSSYLEETALIGRDSALLGSLSMFPHYEKLSKSDDALAKAPDRAGNLFPLNGISKDLKIPSLTDSKHLAERNVNVLAQDYSEAPSSCNSQIKHTKADQTGKNADQSENRKEKTKADYQFGNELETVTAHSCDNKNDVHFDISKKDKYGNDHGIPLEYSTDVVEHREYKDILSLNLPHCKNGISSPNSLEKSAKLKTCIEGPVSVLKNVKVPETPIPISKTYGNNASDGMHSGEDFDKNGPSDASDHCALAPIKSTSPRKIKRQGSFDAPSFDKDGDLGTENGYAMTNTNNTGLKSDLQSGCTHSLKKLEGRDETAETNTDSASRQKTTNASVDDAKAKAPEQYFLFNNPQQNLPSPPMVSKKHFDQMARELEKRKTAEEKMKTELDNMSLLLTEERQAKEALRQMVNGAQDGLIQLKTAYEVWRAKCQETEHRLQQREVALTAVCKQCEGLKKECDAKQVKITQAESDLAAILKQNDDLQKVKQKLEMEIVQQSQEYKSLKNRSLNVERTLQQERARFDRDETHHRGEVAEYKKRLKALEQKFNFVNEQLEMKNSEMNSFDYARVCPYGQNQEDTMTELGVNLSGEPSPAIHDQNEVLSLNIVREPPPLSEENNQTRRKTVHDHNDTAAASMNLYAKQGARPKTTTPTRASFSETMVKSAVVVKEEKCTHCYRLYSDFSSDAEFRAHTDKCES